MKYDKIVAGITSTAWAILPEKMNEILAFIDSKIDVKADAPTYEAIRATKFKNIRGDIGILPLYGVVCQKMNMMTEFSGGTSTEKFGAMFDDAVNDPSIGAIIIDVDSPGGNVFGVAELSKKIYNARGRKPIIAVANSLMASAAYWIATAADEVIATTGAQVGSVGVLAVHTDQSKAEEEAGFKTTIISAGKYKAEGNPHEELGAEASGFIQASVDEYYDMFTSDLARNRGTSQQSIKSGYGQGRVLSAKNAKAEGMVDRVATLEEVIKDILPKGGKATALAQAELDVINL